MPKEPGRLGEILVKAGLIKPAQLDEAIKVQGKEGGRLGEVLVRLGMVREEDLASTIGRQLDIPYRSAAAGELEPEPEQELEKLIPEEFARSHRVLPIWKKLNTLTVAFEDPLDLLLIDNLKKLTRCEITPIVATRTDIETQIEKFYGSISELRKEIGASYDRAELELEAVEEKEESLSLEKLVARAEEAPVIKLVNLILAQAIKDRASDIHIEPYEKRMVIRYRIDGVLYEMPAPAWSLYLPLVSRVKILSKLDIAEKRLPQDGSFHLRTEDRLVDFRISTMPTVFGEKVVLRILDKTAGVRSVKELGMEPDDEQRFEAAITKPYGLIFITGPTGSGKSTTLYAALNRIKSSTRNIITVEDPVEYRLEGINQVEVKTHIGLTFPAALRSILRQDPDIILVGEVRDPETAEISIRAALTGHLVLSTLHTNDAPTAVTRLVDIGLEPFLVGSSLILVVAQRLVRKLCPGCKEAYKPEQALLEKFKLAGVKELYRPKGCDRCRQIGYRGRMAIYEMMLVDAKLREAIVHGKTADEISQIARAAGMRSLWEAGLFKVKRGETSLEEVYSATYVGEE